MDQRRRHSFNIFAYLNKLEAVWIEIERNARRFNIGHERWLRFFFFYGLEELQNWLKLHRKSSRRPEIVPCCTALHRKWTGNAQIWWKKDQKWTKNFQEWQKRCPNRLKMDPDLPELAKVAQNWAIKAPNPPKNGPETDPKSPNMVKNAPKISQNGKSSPKFNFLKDQEWTKIHLNWSRMDRKWPDLIENGPEFYQKTFKLVKNGPKVIKFGWNWTQSEQICSKMDQNFTLKTFKLVKNGPKVIKFGRNWTQSDQIWWFN